MAKKLWSLFLTVAMILVFGGFSAPVEAESPPPRSGTDSSARIDDPGGPIVCPGQSKDQIHKWFTAKWGVRVPLRCGTWSGVKGFGLRKLVAKNRWNPWFKAMIAITLSKPYRIEDDDDTKVYRTRTFFECTPNYLSE